MDVTVELTGTLPIIIIVAALLTTLVSFFLLYLYQRAVTRAMSLEANIFMEANKSVPPSIVSKLNTSPVLKVFDSSFQLETASLGELAYRRAMHSLNQSTIIYVIGGFIYALVLTSAWMIAANSGFNLSRFFWLFSCYCCPLVVAVNLINPTIKNRIIIAYAVIVLLIAFGTLVRSTDLTFGQLIYFWLFANAAGILLYIAFLHRRVRAVGPLILAFMLAAVTGAVIIVNIVGNNEGLLHWIANLGDVLGLGATTIFVLLLLIGFALFGILIWPLLRWFGRAYQKKKMSDQSIILDSLWFLFGVIQSFTLVFEHWAWIFTGIVAFTAYRFVVWIGFSILALQNRKSDSCQTLLILRVFSLGQQSQKLLDLISKIWLRKGNICFIAGPDLVTATVEPHEFLDFMGGQLSRQFVSDESDMKMRIENIDIQPDPDGRYRMNEFFCRTDTWQITMQRLASQSDAVLMDLRSFSKSNQGCIYELHQLLNSVPLERLMLTINGSTDKVFLEMTVREIWQELLPTSPNAQLPLPVIRCFVIKMQSSLEIEKLLILLFGGRLVNT